MRILSLLVVLAMLLSGCGGEAAETATVDPSQDPVVVTDQLLQGEWISDKDPNVSWTFADGQLTEGLKGTPDRSQSGTYTISDDCLNGTGNGAIAAARYLNVVNPDRCFFLVNVTAEELRLSYVGRGNILRFIKK